MIQNYFLIFFVFILAFFSSKTRFLTKKQSDVTYSKPQLHLHRNQTTNNSHFRNISKNNLFFHWNKKRVHPKLQRRLHAKTSFFTIVRAITSYFYFLDFSQNSFDICESEKFNHNRSNLPMNSLKNNSQTPSFKNFYQSFFILLELKISQHL